LPRIKVVMARNVEFNETEAIQKAMEVFWQKGYTGASLRDLTDAMQINSSSLYNTIGDKHQLFVKCIKNYTETKMEEAIKRAQSASSPMVAIINLINDSVNVIINDNKSCMAIKTTFEIAATDKTVQEILKVDSDFTYDFVFGLITKAIEAGEMDKDEDPAMLTDYFISMIAGWHQSFILHQDPIRLKKMGKYLINQLTN